MVLVSRAQAVWQGECERFCALSRNARLLAATSFLFSLASPAISVFISAYILRGTHDVVHVMAYQLALYTGIPVAAYLNGLLLRRFKASTLYGFGLLLSGGAMLAMTTLRALDMTGVVLAGLGMGGATGVLWPVRNLLSLQNTRDQERNYYFGLDSFFYCLSGVVVPALVGAFIAWRMEDGGWSVQLAYQGVAVGVVALTTVACFVLARGRFGGVSPLPFVRLTFDRVWNELAVLAALRGIMQVFHSTVPAMLMMRVLDRGECALGMVQSAGAALAAVLMYLLGRATRPEHRLGMLAAAIGVSLVGSVLNAFVFNTLTVSVFLICLLLSPPMLELVFASIQFRAFDWFVQRDRSCAYAYFCGHEVALYVGRLIGAVAFLAVAFGVSRHAALRYVLAVMATFQLLSLPVARRLLHVLQTEPAAAGKG